MSTNPRIPADLEDRAAQILGNHLVRIHRLTQRLSTFPWLAHTSESWEPPINEVIPIDSAKQANEILSLFDPARNQMWTALETIGNISGTFSLMQAAEEYWIATFVFPDDPESKWDRYLPTIKTDIVGALRETVLDTLLPIGFFRQTLTWYEKGRLLCGIVNGRPAVW